MKPLKILFPVHVFFPTHFYGTETYTLELAQTLKRLGHEAVILTSTPPGEKGAGTIESSYEYGGLPVHCIDLNFMPYRRFKDTYYRPELSPLFRDIVSKISPDIVHVTHLMHHTSTLLEVLREADIPTVATLTDFYGICFNSKLERHDGSLCSGPDTNSINCLMCYLRLPKGLIRNLVNSSITNDRLLAIILRAAAYLATMPGLRKCSLSNRVRDVTCRVNTLRQLYSIFKCMIAPTSFLYNTYAANRFYPNRLKKIPFGISLELVKSHQRTKIKTDAFVRFGYIGQISWHKGVDLLIRSYLQLRGDNKSLVIYGPVDQLTPYMNELRRLSRDISHIEFRSTFPRDELPRRLSELDFLVIPSRWHENSPMVLLYALAAKTPVIAADVKGMSELVTDDVNGYMFRKDSVEHLTSIMQKVVDNPRCVERLSQNATYTKDISDHVADVLNLYEATLVAQGNASVRAR